uniref:Uncharacterized protein n=1 Tax=Avena sativa TaxID=4498 RepID=A0ACD5XPP4_AVESA
MSLSSAVGWWEEWQLRILVLGSLFIQYLLYFSAFLGRRRLRVLVWIAYIGSDAVAIYALATLFNRQKKTWDGGKSSALEVLWAPVLLIQLGGQPFISAYSLEDNELWKRHTVTLVSQVTVALYVFCKWWSGEKIILAAAILLFVVGILKFAQKPWALRTASFNSMQASSNVLSLEEVQRPTFWSDEEYVQAAKKCSMHAMLVGSRNGFHVWGIRNGFHVWGSYMFSDLSIPYSIRVKTLEYLLMHDAYGLVKECLRETFSMLYTRKGSVTTPLGLVSLLLLPFLTLASTVLFATSHKDGQNEKDILVTYILFGCTTVLEFLFPCMAICYVIPCCRNFLDNLTKGWHDTVYQCNLLSFCVRQEKPTCLIKLVTFNSPREFINQHWYIQQIPVAFQIIGVVRQHVEHGWKKYIHDAASYKRFGDLRGQWAIRRHHQLGWSLKKPFDQSILVWHIATDVCFYHPNTHPRHRQREATERSREISNYMVYLLVIRPEMLMPGTRADLFTLASNEIIKNSNKQPDMTEQSFAQEILRMPMLSSADDTVSNACKLAKELMELDNEEERWTVIQGVWVEMLCYSASRCRGYLHAKSLGDGVECLTTIGLLLSFMGMETLADRHQRSEPPQEEEDEPWAPHSQGGSN